MPPFPEVHLPPFPKVELPPKPGMPAIPELHFPEPEARPPSDDEGSHAQGKETPGRISLNLSNPVVSLPYPVFHLTFPTVASLPLYLYCLLHSHPLLLPGAGDGDPEL
uniref:Uncharacterized protein n=1 Tax=Setaria italica TaxID=4555 RepID=K4AKM7_SETIT